MKIAMIVPYPILPADEGGRVRAYNLLKHIAERDEAMLFTPPAAAYASSDLSIAIHEITPPGRRAQMLSPAFMRKALEIARRERPDVIVSEYPWPGLHGAYLARRLGVPLVLDAPNVEAQRFRSTGSRVWPFVALWERIVARFAASVFAVSEEDRRRFVEAGVADGKLQVVPNGVDPSVHAPDIQAREAVRRELGLGDGVLMVLFFGQLSYEPNRQALADIERELLPRLCRTGKRFAFVIAGKNPGGLARRAASSDSPLVFAGNVPSIAAYINASDVVAVPVTSGGGTRLKVVESIACGTPVVSTTAGAEGIDRAVCEGLLTVADGWDAFAAALLSPGVKRSNTPAQFLDLYSWAAIVSRIRWPQRADGKQQA